MRVEYKGVNLSGNEKEAIWDILCQCDEEFYPPLSARNSSSQKQLKTEDGSSMAQTREPVAYFAEMIRQDFLLAYDDNERIVGFMTFKKDYICESLEKFGRSLYITTICVRSEYRGRHILGMMYEYMETEVTKQCACPRISTRTWSLNQAHLHGLARRGYESLDVLKDDRGKGVDTIYFGKFVDPFCSI